METLRERLTELIFRRRPQFRRISAAEKYACFRAIGASNDAFLHLLAGLMERVDHPTPPPLGSAAAALQSLSCHVGSMARALVAMTGGRHEDLLRRHETLERETRLEVLRVQPVESEAVIIWPSDPDALRPLLVGPKAARLAEVACHTQMEVPPFFSVSVYGYRLFMEASGLRDFAARVLSSVDPRAPGALRDASVAIVRAFENAAVPPRVQGELVSAFRTLMAAHPGTTGVAVRSSAVIEDSECSFAGQFESILNVREADLGAAYKRVVASKYHREALKYAFARGLLDEDIAMPVLVMGMVRPPASGVAYSRCPDRPDKILITAVSGLAQAAVDGRITPDTYILSADDPIRIEEASPGNRDFSLQCAEEGGLREVVEPRNSLSSSVLEETVTCELARKVLALEQHFGSPQDVEWALDEAGVLKIIQTRPLYSSSLHPSPRTGSSRIEGYRILIQGAVRASGGVAAGPVFRLLDLKEIETVPRAAILCVPTTSPRLAGVMETVAGIVAAAGSPAGHMSTIAREFDVPCVVGAARAVAALQDGALVTLDADAGIVYEGEVRELLRPVTTTAPVPPPRDPAREKLQLLLQRVAPLTLTEPDVAWFCPANCRTFHDIARYVHQKSMEAMFELEEPSSTERRIARRLLWRVPMDVLLIDLGGGIAAETDRNVPVDKLQSMPLLALIEGMTDPRLRWAGPVGFDLKGFMSVVVRSAADDQRYGEPNYCLCSKDYVHFATRLAYHFATVDSICGPAINENYARFLFFGGAAIARRREWRAHFLATVLEHNEFTVKRVSDRVEAMLAKRDAVQVEDALVMLGRLMVASRHLDMVLESKACAEALAHAFLSGDYAFERVSRCS
jgi:pyruvate,water dikinase